LTVIFFFLNFFAVAAFNALVVPLAIERQAYIAPRSQGIFEYEAEISAIVSAGAAADRTIYHLEKEHRLAEKKKNAAAADDSNADSSTSTTSISPRYDIDRLLTLVPCVAAQNCTGPLSTEILAALQHRQKSGGAWLGETLSSYFASYLSSLSGEDSSSNREYAGPLLVPTHWAIRLLYDLNDDGNKLVLGAAAVAAVEEKGRFSRKDGEDRLPIDPVRLATVLFDLKPTTNDSSTGYPTLKTEFELMREAYLHKIVSKAAKAGASSPPSPALVLPKLYRNLHKHVTEMRRMENEDHRALVPLVESALAIMRLSCERWFALIGVYLGYLLFRDPPPAARAGIRFVARVSRIFQRAILLSFPAVCWVYGAGLVFSTFASVIFWAGPVLRGLEHLRSATASVAPKEWHDATPAEFERMGGLCAICWGDLDTGSSSSGGGGGDGSASNRESPASVEVTPPPSSEAASIHHIRAAGLPCGHAYHRKCIVGWLQSCYGQGRTPTCPMCQTEVPVRIRYRLPLTTNAIEVEADGGENGAGGEGAEGNNGADGGGGLHRRERGIPGLDMLVDELADEFRHRFEPQGGMGVAPADNNNNQEEQRRQAAAAAAAAAPPVEQPQGAAQALNLERMHPDIQAVLREAMAAAAAQQQQGEEEARHEAPGGEEGRQQRHFRLRLFNRQGGRQHPPPL
jgi:hypothetical protein